MDFHHIQIDNPYTDIELKSSHLHWHIRCKYGSARGTYFEGLILPYYVSKEDCLQSKVFLF